MKKISAFLLVFIITSTGFINSFAKEEFDLNKVISDTATYIFECTKDIGVGSVGGDWSAFGLARSGEKIPKDYYQSYYESVEKYVKKQKGILHAKKHTEYSRLILTLTSIGKDPRNVAGYNLLIPLADYEKTVYQGVNGAIWALIALDSGNYDIPKNTDANFQATREMYINYILENQTAEGGWTLSGVEPDPDITGMALQALSKYQDNERVKKATGEALDSMSKKQNGSGGFTSWGKTNSESCVQMLVALCELGLSVNDERFVKNGYTILDNLMNYYIDGKGFVHTTDETSPNLMATEQAFYSLVAVKRARNGKMSLYRMEDAISASADFQIGIGLKDKNPDVQKTNIINYGKTFADIINHKDKSAIEELASRGIINGKGENLFDPESTMTRAEFATIISRGLGLIKKSSTVFKDVTAKDWFYDHVNTAYFYGIAKGTSENEFNPNGSITREEASVMVARASILCGLDTQMDAPEVLDVLAMFSDYVKVSDWAEDSLAFCYSEGIFFDDEIKINPQKKVTRAEVASMLYNMLILAELI